MRFCKRNSKNSYLQKVLLNGLKTFRYRSRLRLLLGFPDDNGGHTIFSQTLPPVGFRYLSYPFIGESNINHYLSHEGIHFRADNGQWLEDGINQGTPWENIQHPLSTDESRQETLETFKKIEDTTEPTQKAFDSSESTRQSEDSSDSAFSIREKRIDIPDVTGRKKPHPGLSPGYRSSISSGKTENLTHSHFLMKDTTKHRSDNATGEIRDSSRNDLIKHKVREDIFPSKLVKEQVGPEPVQKSEDSSDPTHKSEESSDSAFSIREKRIDIPGSTDTNKPYPGLSLEHKNRNVYDRSEDSFHNNTLRKNTIESNIDIPVVKFKKQKQYNIPSANSQGNFIKKSWPMAHENLPMIDATDTSLHASERLQGAEKVGKRFAEVSHPDAMPKNWQAFKSMDRPAKRPGLEAPKELRNQLSGDGHLFPSPQYGHPNYVNKSNRETAVRIKQLRHAVHQLATKISSQQDKSNQDAKQQHLPQNPPPQVQPIYIVRRSSYQSKPPCAFWERSYLSHFHLKTLI